jgi:hypothetical protein
MPAVKMFFTAGLFYGHLCHGGMFREFETAKKILDRFSYYWDIQL